MAARALHGPVWVLLTALALSGCTEVPESNAAPPADDGATDDEPQAWPLLGHPVEAVVVPQNDPNAAPELSGVVYDTDTGAPLAAADVFATCVRAELGPISSRLSTTNEAGTFHVPDVAGWTGCSEITYEVKAPGFTLAVPLSSSGLQEGTVTYVYAGVVGLLTEDAP